MNNASHLSIVSWWLAAALAMSTSFAGCSLPKIIVLHDPLTVEEHDNLGRVYESRGELNLARQQYEEALKKDKNHVPTLLLLGDLSYRMKDYKTAESAYKAVLHVAPRNGDVCNNLAWVYINTGQQLDEAQTLVRLALETNPEHRPYYLDTLGVILLKLGKTADAINALEESVKTIPSDKTEFLVEARSHLEEAYRAAEQKP